MLRARLEEAFKRFNVEYPDYGILADHYHILGSFGESGQIPKLLQWVNGGVSHQLRKKKDSTLSVWGEYHIFVPMKEELLDRVRGYVVGNPLKHGDVSNEAELRRWPYSTYGRLGEREGWEYAKDIVSSVMGLGEDEFMESLPKRTRRD